MFVAIFCCFMKTNPFQSFCLSLQLCMVLATYIQNLSYRRLKTVGVHVQQYFKEDLDMIISSATVLTAFLHCTARLTSIANTVLKSCYIIILTSFHYVVHSVFLDSSSLSLQLLFWFQLHAWLSEHQELLRIISVLYNNIIM